MKTRSRNEIIKLILESVMTGATKTKIMFRASLSSEQAERHLIFLREQELISEQSRRFYKVTEKGIKFLNKTSELNELIVQINPLIGRRL